MFTALRYHHSSPVLSWTGVHCNGVHTQNLGDDDDDDDDDEEDEDEKYSNCRVLGGGSDLTRIIQS